MSSCPPICFFFLPAVASGWVFQCTTLPSALFLSSMHFLIGQLHSWFSICSLDLKGLKCLSVTHLMHRVFQQRASGGRSISSDSGWTVVKQANESIVEAECYRFEGFAASQILRAAFFLCDASLFLAGALLFVYL
eukprot:RCo017745